MTPGSFIINGINSADIGAHITHWFDIPRPSRRLNLNGDPVGLDRALIIDEKGYNNREFEVTIGVKDEESRDKLLFALDSASYVDAQFYLDEKYIYQVVNADIVATERPIRSQDYREITLKLSAAPFKYLAKAEAVDVKTTATIKNPMRYASKPKITLTGTGAMSIKVNDATINLKGVEGSIIIDSELSDTYRLVSGTVYNENNKMSRTEYPVLKPGNNTITVTNATAKIEGRWRTI